MSSAEQIQKLWSWRYSHIHGWHWRHDRDCTSENAQAWLTQFQTDEPDVTFLLKTKKPKPRPTP